MNNQNIYALRIEREVLVSVLLTLTSEVASARGILVVSDLDLGFHNLSPST